jgi:hypothetical protein
LDKFIFEKNLKWIPYNKFENVEYLDKGGFGTIYKANLSDKNKEVVLKCLNNLNENLDEFLNEVHNNYFKFFKFIYNLFILMYNYFL